MTLIAIVLLAALLVHILIKIEDHYHHRPWWRDEDKW